MDRILKAIGISAWFPFCWAKSNLKCSQQIQNTKPTHSTMDLQNQPQIQGLPWQIHLIFLIFTLYRNPSDKIQKNNTKKEQVPISF